MNLRKRRDSKATCFAAIFLVVTTLVITTAVVSTPPALALGPPPIVHIGNPHDFSPGPPIPSCNADFNQGPPDDPLKGCRDTP